MSESLAYIALIALFLVFSVTLAVIVLRFTAVLQQMKRADSMDRSELMRELDLSHTQAFTNAMSALGDVQARVVESQVGMFNRTMDMVHGPVKEDAETVAGDNAGLDMRMLDGELRDEDDPMRYFDPTDDDEWLDPTRDMMPDHGPRAVSVRPGETLVPGQ